MKQVTIYSDGACEGNPGPGGWAAVLVYGEKKKEIAGAEIATTNNRMELRAAIEALGALKEPCEVEFYTDSEYVRNGITAWIHSWKRKGWKKPIKNQDLWKALDAAAGRHKVKWHWVRGHAGNPLNERCDTLAVAEIAKLRATKTKAEIKAAVAEFKVRQAADGAATPGPELL